ncbi:aminoglycoside phosphotransferase [Clostridium intestinale URNW]|uniref:Aminoglycoside phosphotransferase n=2 Tax=Clostridium intestinale TaxID=36845 RepID=U2PXX8_9CLOT|nr:aminoglycoside phosphotransferase [Clostridium intestinale URNW]
MILVNKLASEFCLKEAHMNYLDILQDSIDYIEDNLKSEISAEELSKKAGFSIFHYYHLFQKGIGIPVNKYILKRKLHSAIYEISLGKKIVDVALSYGFDTYAGFFKAFKREYGCSPKEYMKKYKINKPYRINLRQEEHVMITEKQIKKILLNWDLRENADIKSLYGFNGSKLENIWGIDDKFILKASINLAGLKQHILISKDLHEAGFDGPIPVETTNNKEYVEYQNIYFMLSRKIEGKSLTSKEVYEDLNKARYLGEIIGQLHLILERYDKDLICNEPDIKNITSGAHEDIKNLMNLPIDFYKKYDEEFGKLYPYLNKHIIHRDPNPSNIIMRDDKLVSFIDFELSERNLRIFDPCYAATSILSETFSEKTAKELEVWFIIFKEIIEGYDSVCNLTKEEKQAIPYVIYSIQIVCIAYFSKFNKYKNLTEINIKMLKFLYENEEKLIVR